MAEPSLPALLAVWALPVLLAITLHEVAHGYCARLFGDPTAARAGRLSLNPMRHIDPVGTLLVPGLLLALGGFIFGWAKPVPVSMHRLRNPRRDMAIVAAAGPAANLAMAVCWGALAWLAALQGGGVVADFVRYAGFAGVLINVILAVLNLLPVPPLDGSRVLAALAPPNWERAMARIEPYGLVILLILLVTGLLGALLWPPVRAIQGTILAFFGLG